jgi:hypothetical protein
VLTRSLLTAMKTRKTTQKNKKGGAKKTAVQRAQGYQAPGNQPTRNGKGRRAKKRFGRPTTDPDIVMHASGATGTDIRNPARESTMVGMSSISVNQQDPSLNVEVRINNRSLAYVSAGVILRAMAHGWLGAPGGETAYAAFVYLFNSLKNSVEGTFPTLQSAPIWFWELNAALLGKTERMKTGRVTYKGFNLDDGQGVSQNFVLGTGEYSYSIFWGNVISGNGDVNGYPILSPAPAYLEEDGERAIQSLFDYFSENGLCKRIGTPDAGTLAMSHDTSAFAAVYSEYGASYFSTGGSATTLQSERRITSPIFSKFGPYQDDDNLWRGYHEYHRGAGSPFYLGPRLTEMENRRQIRNKVPPIFKWYDFDQFFEHLSLALCLAIEENYKGTGTLGVPCPLTSQQVQLMLRQAMLPFFSNGMAQDLRLEQPSWVPFLPFVVGPNGISQGNIGSGPLLPCFIAEEIRAVKRVLAHLRDPFAEKSGVPSNMEIDVLPILGRPSYAVYAPLGNYTYDTGGVGELYSTSLLEVPISLIDASAVVGPVTNYVDLNGPTNTLIVKAWNEWIQQYSGTLVTLVQLSQDKGCDALSTLFYTNQIQIVAIDQRVAAPVPVGVSRGQTANQTTATSSPVPKEKDVPGKLKKQPSKKHLGLSLDHLRHRVGAAPSPGPSEFFTRVVHVGSSSMVGFTSEIWKFLALWALPVALVIAPQNESSKAAYQTNVIEPFYLASSSASTNFVVDATQEFYPILADKNMEFATMNVRAYNSPVKSEMEIEFDALTARGHGGFFTKIAGMIGEGLGIKGSAEFANSVSRFIDI